MIPQITLNSLIREFLASNKNLFIGYIIVLIITPIRDIGIPHIIGKILESLRNKNISYYYIYVLLATLVIIQIGGVINDFIDIKFYPIFQKFISKKILDYVFEQSSSNLQDILNGKVLSILAHFPRTLYNYMEAYKAVFIPQVFVFIIAIIYIGVINIQLCIIMIILVIIYYYISLLTMSNCQSLSKTREKYLNDVNENVDDVLTNVTSILNANTRESEMAYLNTYYDEYKAYGILSIKCTVKYKFILMPILLLSLLAFIVIGYQLCMQNKIKVEQFTVMIIIYLYVFNSIIKTTDDFRDAAFRQGALTEDMNIFQSMPSANINHTPYNVDPELAKRYIYFDKVNYYYEAEDKDPAKRKYILKDFTLDIKQGEKLLIVGQIGSGKTTILKLLMRYKTPMSGHIYYRGTPFEIIPREDIRNKIGYIPQNPILLNRTLYENIVYGSQSTGSQSTGSRSNRKASKQEVIEMIKYLKLEHIFSEDRLDQMVGKHGSKLSGGQRQVVWILRMLVQDPEILLMDEPTASIDKETKTFIDRLFKLVMQNRTVIIVSHDEYMSKIVDRTISM